MDITEKVKALGFPVGEYAVVGSGLLAALGLRSANDLDIAATPSLIAELRATGEWREEYKWGKLFLAKDGIDILTRLDWDAYPTTTEEAIKTATMIGGVPFLNLNETIRFKRALRREKDMKDIELLEAYRKGKRS